jgi:hypothetical protein
MLLTAASPFAARAHLFPGLLDSLLKAFILNMATMHRMRDLFTKKERSGYDA